MKPWKLVLGAGAACAACCAAPLVGGLAALGVGSGVFAGGMAAWSAHLESWWPLAAGALAIALAGGLFLWRRGRPAKPNTAACGCPATAGRTGCANAS